MLENPIIDNQKDAEFIDLCSCGCGEYIVKGCEYIRWEDKYFNDTRCLVRYMTVTEDFEEV